MRNKRDSEMRRLQDFNRDLKGEGSSVYPSQRVLSVPWLFQTKCFRQEKGCYCFARPKFCI